MTKEFDRGYIKLPLDDQDLDSKCRSNEALLLNNAALAVVQGTWAETMTRGIVLHVLVLLKADPEDMAHPFRIIARYLVGDSRDENLETERKKKHPHSTIKHNNEI